MATNQQRFVKNLGGAAEPLVMLEPFQAGATQAIKRGELLELTGVGNTRWVPMDSDFAMDSNVAIANEEIKSGDLAGYYGLIVPRPDDLFRFALAAAGANARGVALYWSDSETLTITAGTNIVGYTGGQFHYPVHQSHASDDAGPDMGTTIKSVSTAEVFIREAVSLYSAFIL